MTVYCGVDFHTRQQLIKWCDTQDGETVSPLFARLYTIAEQKPSQVTVQVVEKKPCHFPLKTSSCRRH